MCLMCAAGDSVSILPHSINEFDFLYGFLEAEIKILLSYKL